MEDFLDGIVKFYNEMSVFETCMLTSQHEDPTKLQFGKDLLHAIAASVDAPSFLSRLFYSRKKLVNKYNEDVVNLCEVLTGRKKDIDFKLGIYSNNIELLEQCAECLKEMQGNKA